ncbi:hypothetical protein BS78_09G110900 [Paspalum vaginatum]|nr:hypothetical protein BS78_09G110900 [Paspalum vaginatum]
MKLKRRRDAIYEMGYASKKKRSAVAAALERGNENAKASVAAAATISSPVVQEQYGNRDGGKSINKKGNSFLGESRSTSGGVVNGKEEEKFWPCLSAAPVQGLDCLRQDPVTTVKNLALLLRSFQKLVKRDHHQIIQKAPRLIKKSCSTSALTVYEGSDGAVDQVNMQLLLDPFTGPEQLASRSSLLLMHEAKAASYRIGSIFREVRRFRGGDSTLVMKALSQSINEHRLLLLPQLVSNSPLKRMLTQEEYEAVHREGKDGQPMKVFDRHGNSFQMNLKFLESDKQYGLTGEWPKLVKLNGLCKGDNVNIGAFRSDRHLALTLWPDTMEEQPSKETEAAEGAEEVEAAGGTAEEQSSAGMEEATSVEEMEAAEGLLALSDFKDVTKL